MKARLLVCLILTFIIGISLHAQEKNKLKFGNVKPDDFKTTVYSIDSNASAVILADVGSTEIVGNQQGNFSLEFKNYRRAHILNKNGYDIGDVVIDLFTNGSAEENIINLKAVTYNLENGKVIETKLDVKGAVFKDKINKNWIRKKFTFPNIKEGSIIEYEYKIESDFITNLQPWTFQGEYPCLWSEYNVAMPEFYNYVTLTQGFQTYHIRDSKRREVQFDMADNRGAGATERGSFRANVTDYRWVMKNVPALKEESFTSTVKNHVSRIEFQLSTVGPPFQYQQVMASWTGVTKNLLESEYFGAPLSKENGWLNDVMPAALGNAKTPVEKAHNIYKWVRDNYTCTQHSGRYLDQSLKSVLKSRNGNVAEINLLLTAILRKADIIAEPVVLSTKWHGYTHSVYPLMDRFNYVITQVRLDDNIFYLDATEPKMGFGHLDPQCYNGHARIVNETATAIDLSAETLKEAKISSVFIVNDEKGKIEGRMVQTPGYYESYSLRKKLKDKGQEQVGKDMVKAMGMDVELSNLVIDSLNRLEDPLGITFDFDIKSENADILYINPMFGEGYKENPFKSAQRLYPVEMPYTFDEVFTLQMEIPKGYVIDELPKQQVVKFNEEGDASFEYRISESGGQISMRSRVIVKRAFFDKDEYETLREFFNLIVSKHNEQIVFKKKK